MTSSAVRPRRELAQVPITAVAFCRDPATQAPHVLAGEDTDLVVYRAAADGEHEAEQRVAVARFRVFTAQPIHGIHVRQPDAAAPGRVLLWGGSAVAVVRIEDLFQRDGCRAEAGVDCIARLRAPDWIYDGAVSPADADRAVLVTAHNEVITLRYDAEKRSAALSSVLVSPSRPMLYAANVRWTARNEVLVAAGTVFGDILVWRHTFDADSTAHSKQSLKPRMLFSLSGHEGSIFGVYMSPLLEMPDKSIVRLLASCSDDRTIRIWNITETEGEHIEEAVPSKAVQEISDTGFRCAPAVYGQDGEADANGRADVSPIAAAMGHASRIWAVRFGTPNVEALTSEERRVWSGGKDALVVYSFGEDATVQRWSVDVVAALQSPQLSKLTHEKTYALHNGKHLWSRDLLCTLEDGAATTYILAGGSDSKVTLVKETTGADGESETYNSAETWDIQDIAPPPPTIPGGKPRKEMISRYDFLTPDVILAVSSLGKVCLGTFEGKEASWAELTVKDTAVAEDMQNIYALKTVSHGAALLGSTTGGVYYFGLAQRRIVKVASLAGRVVEMNALSKTFEGATGDAEAIVHLHRDANSVYLTLDRETGEVKSQEEIAGLDSRFVAISATRIDDLLAIGSRHGWISLLRRGSTGAFQPILNLPPASGDSVTAIVPLPPSPDAEADDRTKYVLTTSRDGKYRIFALHVDAQADTARMDLVHETTPPFGPWIEGGWFTGDAAPELILYGFRSKDFVVWNETRREELATMDCGGAHRTFRLACDERRPAAGAGTVRFAFTRTSRLSVHSQRGIAYAPLRLGAHGREIRSLSAKGPGGRYVATGAEDASIRLWEYEHGSGKGRRGKMRYMAYLKRHTAGLQKVQWLGDEYLFSSGGREELFAWRVRRLDSAYAGRIAVVCEGVFLDKSPVEDLRIMDFDVSMPEAGSLDGGMLVTMAFSNSALKTYRYTAAEGFMLVCEGMYTGACLTQARHLHTKGNVLHVLTASTDGHIALWRGAAAGEATGRHDVPRRGLYELSQTLRVHQNSLKSLDMTRLAGGRDNGASHGGSSCYGVLTGGDDNALAWTLLKRAAAVSRGAEEEEDAAAAAAAGDGDDYLGFTAERGGEVVRRAHAAAITGIAILGGGGGGGDVRGVSVSNDQWVKVWKMGGGGGGGGEGIQLLGEGYSGVADAGDVVVLGEEEEEDEERRRIGNFRGQRVMVGGVGLEVWRLE